MRKTPMAAIAAFAFVAASASAANVKVTPLGTHDGEFCAQDRALVFEDPNGTRVLYDPGRSVAGAEDPRLGKIDVVLVTHMSTPPPSAISTASDFGIEETGVSGLPHSPWFTSLMWMLRA